MGKCGSGHCLQQGRDGTGGDADGAAATRKEQIRIRQHVPGPGLSCASSEHHRHRLVDGRQKRIVVVIGDHDDLGRIVVGRHHDAARVRDVVTRVGRAEHDGAFADQASACKMLFQEEPGGEDAARLDPEPKATVPARAARGGTRRVVRQDEPVLAGCPEAREKRRGAGQGVIRCDEHAVRVEQEDLIALEELVCPHPRDGGEKVLGPGQGGPQCTRNR